MANTISHCPSSHLQKINAFQNSKICLQIMKQSFPNAKNQKIVWFCKNMQDFAIKFSIWQKKCEKILIDFTRFYQNCNIQQDYTRFGWKYKNLQESARSCKNMQDFIGICYVNEKMIRFWLIYYSKMRIILCCFGKTSLRWTILL